MPRAELKPATLASLASLCARRLALGALRRAVSPILSRPAAGLPTRILFAPETVGRADPRMATDIYAGVYALSGEVVDAAGRSPFTLPNVPDPWARALHGFGWLVHLEAHATALTSSNARALFDDWLNARRDRHQQADLPTVTAARAVAWLVQAPLLLNGAEAAFRQRYMRALARHMRRLERWLTTLSTGEGRLEVAAALALAGTVVADAERAGRIAMAALIECLAQEILADGGHASRSPAALLDAAARLVVLREALVRRQSPVPQPLAAALARMLPMLRFLRHGDGGLALWHGAEPVAPDTVDAVLAHDDVGGAPLGNARHSGFQRLVAGGSQVLLDTGAPPPPAFGRNACASLLAFELSHGPQRIIVNCGALGSARAEWGAAARASAAHSTLVLADTSSARILTLWPLSAILGPVLHGGAHRITVQRDRYSASASHDAYLAAFGVTHTRTVTLGSDGLWLSGEDGIVGQDRLAGHPYAIRFHLHPDVKVRLDGQSGQAVLSLPDGAIWLFHVDRGPQPRLEESLVLVAPRKARRSHQIVVAGDTLTDDAVHWHIARHGAPLEGAGDPQSRKAEP